MSIRTASSNPAYRRDGGTPPPMAVQACPDTVAEDRMGDGDRRYGFCCTKGPRQAHARLLTTMSTGRCPVAASAHCLRMWGTGPTVWFGVTDFTPCHAWPEFVQDKEAQLHRPACTPTWQGRIVPDRPRTGSQAVTHPRAPVGLSPCPSGLRTSVVYATAGYAQARWRIQQVGNTSRQGGTHHLSATTAPTQHACAQCCAYAGCRPIRSTGKPDSRALATPMPGLSAFRQTGFAAIAWPSRPCPQYLDR